MHLNLEEMSVLVTMCNGFALLLVNPVLVILLTGDRELTQNKALGTRNANVISVLTIALVNE